MEVDLTNIDFDNKINTLMNNINNITTITNMINLKCTIYNTINLYNANIEKLKKLIETIENKLEKECNHEWKRDHSYYGEHSQYQCLICKLYK